MNTKMNFDMYVPTHTLFGAGMLNHLHSQKMPEKKALLIISNGKSTKINGYLKRTEEQLQKAGVEFTIFDQIEANPLKRSWQEEMLPEQMDVILKIIAVMIVVIGAISGVGICLLWQKRKKK